MTNDTDKLRELISEYHRAVYALQLELPSSVFDDFKAKSDVILDALEAANERKQELWSRLLSMEDENVRLAALVDAYRQDFRYTAYTRLNTEEIEAAQAELEAAALAGVPGEKQSDE